MDAAPPAVLADAFRSFDADETLQVAVLAGADLKAIAAASQMR